MGVNGIGSNSTLVLQSLVDMRRQLDDLQRQLGTGRKAETYAGIGIDRGLTVGLRSRLSAIDSFDNTILNIGVRLDLAQTALTRISKIGQDVKGAVLLSPFDIDVTGQTSTQKAAHAQLSEILEYLNSQAGERYLFSGLSGDKPAVETLDHIMEGDGVRAGLKQIMAERNQADLGATGLGRLVITAPTADSVSVAEDVAGSPFGFKLAAVTSTLTNAVVVGPAGSPPAISVDLSGGQPNAGETIQFRFDLPDGSSESITLTATASATPGPNEFAIGASTAATAANLQAALTGAIGKLAKTSLQAASSLAAASDFFAIDDANPPRRVDGPPFDTATALIAGTPANTVSWYIGEGGTAPARTTAAVRVDESIRVSYGLRANEEGIRWMVQNVATFAAVTYSQSDPDAEARHAALNQRLISALAVPAGVQKVEHIQADLATAQTTITGAKDRHVQTRNTLIDLLQQVDGVSAEEVATRILALQTRLQASLQTTALLYRTSLVNFL